MTAFITLQLVASLLTSLPAVEPDLRSTYCLSAATNAYLAAEATGSDYPDAAYEESWVSCEAQWLPPLASVR